MWSVLSPLREGTQWVLQRVAQSILPLRCAMCGVEVETRGVCGPCWTQCHFLTAGSCGTCGLPLPLLPTINEGPAFENMLQCGRCVAKPPPFTRSLSVFVYDDKSRSFIFRLKHGKDLSLVPLLARWLYVRGRLIWSGCDVIVPVPLHWTRMAWRSFNQSALLTRGLSRLTGLPHNPSLLKRVKRTPPQGHLTVHQRADNVRHAFRVNQKHLESLQGARVVLVDDVYTTGATLTACARTLLRAGAQSVSVLTLARVAHNPFDA